ncbi:MAG TPA: GYF domain-containing protein [Polyangiales bacterium]
MKFLCSNCKAKYQIADDKVAGRTLRMTCQQCGEPIAVRGPGRAAAQISRPISQPLVPTAIGAPPAISSLGADFQRQVASPTHDAGARGADEWHVAINDVPVGPMRREEVARKIGMGAVDRESLAWREGMDDWMPARHIPELAVLFSAREPAPLVAPPPAAVPIAPSAPLQPAVRVEMAPIGGRQMLTLDDYAPPVEPVISTVTVSPVPATAPPAGGKPLGWAPMFALVSGGAFILAVGAVLGVRVLAPAPAAAPAQRGTAGTGAPMVAAPAQANPNPGRDSQGNVIELDMQAIDGQSTGGGQRRVAAAQAPAAGDKNKAAAGKALTDEQKAMLARMGSGLDQGPSNIRTGTDNPQATSGGGGSGGQLTAEQLSAVVLRGRKNLQRCYETALRGSGSDETVRMDVDIEVSPSGNVTGAHTSGKGLPGMDECLVRTVRMWRFPSSGEGAATRFPVVFQPGG